MSVCTTTGLTQDQQQRWSYLFKHLVEEIEIPDLTSIEPQQLKALDGEISKILKKIGDAKAKSRDSLTKHLKGVLFRRFGKNAIVEAFGSSVTDLSIGQAILTFAFPSKTKHHKES